MCGSTAIDSAKVEWWFADGEASRVQHISHISDTMSGSTAYFHSWCRLCVKCVARDSLHRLHTITQLLRYVFTTETCIVKQQYLPHGKFRLTNGWDGSPANFNGFRFLASLLQPAKLCTMFRYTFSSLLSGVKFTLRLSLALSLCGTRVVGVSQTFWHWSGRPWVVTPQDLLSQVYSL